MPRRSIEHPDSDHTDCWHMSVALKHEFPVPQVSPIRAPLHMSGCAHVNTHQSAVFALSIHSEQHYLS